MKRCKVCNKALRDFNKSGVCSNCARRTRSESYALVKKKKLYDLKILIDDLIKGIK